MTSVTLGSDEGETSPLKRRADVLSDTDITSESESQSEYEEGRGRSRSRRHQKGASTIGCRLVKRRQGGRSETVSPKEVLEQAVTPPTRAALEESSEFEDEVSERMEEADFQETPTPSPEGLKWKKMPYPGLPQVGYAFSYASGPICFVKVPTAASKFLAAHWHPPQNYVAYVIWSMHPSFYVDNKLRGLEMVNELAANGFINDQDVEIHEEVVQDTRTLSFKKGNITVSIPKLGEVMPFRTYWPGMTLVEEDRKAIEEKLRSVMYERALPTPTPMLTTPPTVTKCSDESTLEGSTLTTSSENEEEMSGSSGSLEESGLINFVKVHWRKSKWIVDNIQLVRPHHYSSIRAPTSSGDTMEEKDEFKVVIVWSNKAEKKEGIDLLYMIMAARSEGISTDYLEDVMKFKEVMEDGEMWSVFHKKNVVVGFPGPKGEAEFVESFQAMEDEEL